MAANDIFPGYEYFLCYIAVDICVLLTFCYVQKYSFVQ